MEGALETRDADSIARVTSPVAIVAVSAVEARVALPIEILVTRETTNVSADEAKVGACIDTVASPVATLSCCADDARTALSIWIFVTRETVRVSADDARDGAPIMTVATPRSSDKIGADDASETGFMLTVTATAGWNRGSPTRGLNLLSRGDMIPYILYPIIPTRALCSNRTCHRPMGPFRA